MNERQEQLLKFIVESHINLAEPIGSKLLADEGDLEVSGATIRNEMRELEEQGYLTHPHTSSGRIPTEAGYKYYVENIMLSVVLSKKVKSEMEELAQTEKELAAQIKRVGKFIAEWTDSAVVVAFSPDNIYYTGISNLFSQPEFQDYDRVVQFSNIFDQCEDRIEYLFALIKNNQIKILVGGQNPLGAACSLVGTRVRNGGLFVLLGPVRMDYARNASVAEFVSELFE
ncbi:MAG: hypothetical protein A2921_01530 [Candidatus Magasanikbacteria bacterium RIFCSPLOWO2_01_FULL_43_20b]|uniref:Heat-inducible transcription repressor HrcA C-terminal domain-containing protein n=1 Tax=Candidatus Magasanikbacteria bacterium RIFCSPLOWO2_12_FULL_43_12 TaxID=1798692 RepID=A0A1F6MQN4_9BACT|nr:MAG: hypothetical protein A3C74_02200 [Candidatus Magasanikbacteria bacterium RIFCSPHIGHO2_02_FULL_44_13]OGH71971.1 MAG: hypothetical protein A3I93_03050 [Candidatus Magasanikbacteria bacterium RIFCSPLOWO2_02_FULL_43_22]OGH73487.1 MAG: hypothetical protein A2921_01530 [Candidatus Magasanikbacteria bacterium RIFCSPLOWO2_01_FULL_43_20b]OGH73974.1 MAG: hypothetical protein A3G00_03655 [Candidatus Magasanikbacteria bacterium RIFCSPLOWO2_12_FULL_43_12]